MKNVPGPSAAVLSLAEIVTKPAARSLRGFTRITKGRRTPFALPLAVLIAVAGPPSAPAQFLQLGSLEQVPSPVQVASQHLTPVGGNASKNKPCSPEYWWYDEAHQKEKCHECTYEQYWDDEDGQARCHHCRREKYWTDDDGWARCHVCTYDHYLGYQCHSYSQSQTPAPSLVPSLVPVDQERNLNSCDLP